MPRIDRETDTRATDSFYEPPAGIARTKSLNRIVKFRGRGGRYGPADSDALSRSLRKVFGVQPYSSLKSLLK